jgi:hypothetical protein
MMMEKTCEEKKF